MKLLARIKGILVLVVKRNVSRDQSVCWGNGGPTPSHVQEEFDRSTAFQTYLRFFHTTMVREIRGFRGR